jgi:hypothetical protein
MRRRKLIAGLVTVTVSTRVALAEQALTPVMGSSPSVPEFVPVPRSRLFQPASPKQASLRVVTWPSNIPARTTNTIGFQRRCHLVRRQVGSADEVSE